MIGQIVPQVKDDVSHDANYFRAHIGRMSNWQSEKDFNAAYLARVRELRIARGWTSEQMANALQVPPDRYRKNESRTPLPHYLVPRFAQLVGRDIAFILTGQTEGRRAAPTSTPPDPDPAAPVINFHDRPRENAAPSRPARKRA